MLFYPLLQIESKLREWYYYSLLAKTKYPRSHHKQFNVNYAKVTSVKEPFLTPDHVCVDKAANNGAKLFVGNRQKNFSELGIKPRMHLVEISIFSPNHVIVRPSKIMNNLLKFHKICTFKVIFRHQKSTESFWTFFIL